MSGKARRACRVLSLFLSLLTVLFSFTVSAEDVPAGDAVTVGEPAPAGDALGITAKSAFLCDADSGAVLYEKNADEPLPPASVTKVMTLLLLMEAVDGGEVSLSDPVTVSANAASMGGSQVYLKEGETMTVEEMLKCVVIASANDCAVALAEFLAGSEEAFVERMNARAAELGMENTHFENTNGLDDTVTGHLISARDVAAMSRELLKHETILKYSGIWMDSIRDGAFGLTNTNRLVRFYRGCTGLKTGSTGKAGFCVSATAERDGLSLVCVIMGASSRDERNREAAKLLDYGFANFSAYRAEPSEITVPVKGGVSQDCRVLLPEFSAAVPHGCAGKVEKTLEIPEALTAPVDAGDVVGQAVFTLGGKEIGRVDALASEPIDKITFGTLFRKLLAEFLLS